MGAAVKTIPLGYIEVSQGRARFVEIIDRGRLLQAGLILGGAALFFLARLAWGKRE